MTIESRFRQTLNRPKYGRILWVFHLPHMPMLETFVVYYKGMTPR
jgi:hypothetical protein